MQVTRLRPGDEVTVEPIESDAYILNFQRYCRVARIVDTGYYVHLGAVWPADQEFGPIPAARLKPGWKDAEGHWR